MTWQPDFKNLYEAELEELKANMELFGTYPVPKWKKDLLLYLLIKSLEKPSPKAKILRKKVAIDLEKISKEAWEHYARRK